MSAYAEPLILYAVLFFRISAGAAPSAEAETFSTTGELIRIFGYNLPSLALVWYLLLRVKSFREWGVTLPKKWDIFPTVLSFAALLLIGLTISAVSRTVAAIPQEPSLAPPVTFISWATLAVSCFSTAYLEESFFRFYLLSKRAEMSIGRHRAVLVSALFFSVCHIYEGPWGFLNAAFSGIVLAFVFIRFRSLHGIAVAHALYNFTVYILAAV